MGVFFFLTLRPSFPDFGDFDPCKGSADSQLVFSWFPRNAGICCILEWVVSNVSSRGFWGCRGFQFFCKRSPVGGQNRSICHFAFSLVLQCLGVLSCPDAGENSTKNVIVTPLFECP